MILEEKAAKIRLKTLMTMYKAGVPYVGSTLSLVEVMVALYYGDIMRRKILNLDPANPGSVENDALVLSKGDACALQYAILADMGFFDASELDYMGQIGSFLKLRPVAKIPGVSVSVPQDGQGLSLAAGLALSFQAERRSNRTFCVMDESELSCGQVWEAAEVAAYYKLDKLIAVVDAPKVDVDPSAKPKIRPEKLQDKFEAFGWKVIQITDAHDFDKLVDGFARAFGTVRRPTCIWCNTVGGKGVNFLERKANYLRVPLSEGEFGEVLSQLHDKNVALN